VQHKVVIWDDRQIGDGKRWHDAIQTALGKSKVVLVLASVGYFGSVYIAEHELPVIIKAHEAGDMTLLTVPVDPYLYHNPESPLNPYKTAFQPKEPLRRRDSNA